MGACVRMKTRRGTLAPRKSSGRGKHRTALNA